MWKAEEHGKQDRPEFAECSRRKKVDDDLFEVVKDETAVLNAHNDTRE